MSKLAKFAAVAVALVALSSVPALANWDHQVESTLEADNGKHPKTLTQMLVVPAAEGRGKRNLCVGYANDFNKKSAGDLKTTFEIAAVDPVTEEESTQKVVVRGTLRRNFHISCREVKGLQPGDTVIATHEFKAFPRFREGTINIIVSIGREKLERDALLPAPIPPAPPAPPAPPPGGGGGGGDGGGDGGGGGGGGTPPPTSGALSGADQSAINKLRAWAAGSRGVQLRMQPGNRHYVDRRVSGVISEVGPFGSIAAAVDAHCRATGCSGGGGLSGSDQSSVVKIRNWSNGSGRRLGLRFESGGRIHLDWQPPREGVHTGPFSSITAAVNNFCRITRAC